MAAEAREAGQCGKRCLQPLDRFHCAEPAEIARRDDRQQIDTDIGRRGTTRDHRDRHLLEIVGRQHVVGRRHDELEEAPGLSRNVAHHPSILVDDSQSARPLGRRADPPRHRWRHRPQQPEGQRQWPGPAAPIPGEPNAEPGNQHRARHAAIKGRHSKCQVARQLRRRHPLQKMTASDGQPHKSPQDCVPHQPRLVGEKDDGQCPARRRQFKFVAERP